MATRSAPEGAPTLTATSYAILGHLALRSWTMYEIAREMQRNVTFFFHRAESQVYAEPKRLVGLGLAAARVEYNGRRNRTVYEITEAGRAELARWLALPPARGPSLEFEALLRVMLAPMGRDADLAATLADTRARIAPLLVTAERIRGEYLAGEAPFQHHMIYRSMMHDFLTSFAELVDDWAERSLARMQEWPDQAGADRAAAALSVFEKLPRCRPAGKS